MLKDSWTDKIDRESDVMAEDINLIAYSVMDLEEEVPKIEPNAKKYANNAENNAKAYTDESRIDLRQRINCETETDASNAINSFYLLPGSCGGLLSLTIYGKEFDSKLYFDEENNKSAESINSADYIHYDFVSGESTVRITDVSGELPYKIQFSSVIVQDFVLNKCKGFKLAVTNGKVDRIVAKYYVTTKAYTDKAEQNAKAYADEISSSTREYVDSALESALSKTEYITDFVETDPQNGTTVTLNGNKIHVLHEEFDNSIAQKFRYVVIGFPIGILGELKDKMFLFETDIAFDKIGLSPSGISTSILYKSLQSYNGVEFNAYDLVKSYSAPPSDDTLIYLVFQINNPKTTAVHPYVEGDITVCKVGNGNVVADELSESLQAELDAKYLCNVDDEKYITCWGDSLTAMGGWTTRLQTLSGLTVYNGGVGGENSDCISARQGADSMIVNGITIPAGTSEVLLATTADGGILTEFGNRVKPALQHLTNLNPVMIGDVEGSISKTTDGWFFTRTTAGESVTIDRPTAIRTNHEIKHNSPYLMTIFMGQNDGTKYDSNNTNIEENLEALIRKHRLMLEHARTENFVILGLSSGTAESRATYESRMKKEFGRYFVSLREYLSTPIYDADGNIISCYGLDDQNLAMGTAEYGGTTYNSEDEIVVGSVPHQCLRDNVHYTTATMEIVGDLIYKKCKELGVF